LCMARCPCQWNSSCPWISISASLSLQTDIHIFDQLQTELIARCIRVPPCPLESRQSYCTRVRRHAAQVIKAHKWSEAWRMRIQKWQAHLSRHPEAWAARLLRYHDSAWLMRQRIAHNSPSVMAGRTGTRACNGRASARWPGDATRG
jgi:hypothetical protein